LTTIGRPHHRPEIRKNFVKMRFSRGNALVQFTECKQD
jgi:hypothetical protein